jgi:hypothetical protein
VTTRPAPRSAARRRTRTGVAALAVAGTLLLAPVGAARGAGFLDDVAAGRAAGGTAVAAAGGGAARASAVQGLLAAHGGASAGFAIGVLLAALDADLARGSAARSAGDRELVERQVGDLLAAQAEAGIGNRALCLLGGRTEPKSLERQVRLVAPRWSCERH